MQARSLVPVQYLLLLGGGERENDRDLDLERDLSLQPQKCSERSHSGGTAKPHPLTWVVVAEVVSMVDSGCSWLGAWPQRSPGALVPPSPPWEEINSLVT